MSVIKRSSTFGTAILPAILVLAASAVAVYKVEYLGYDSGSSLPHVSYYVETVMEFDGHGTPVEISMALPQNQEHQRVSDESFDSDDLKFSVAQDRGERRGVWTSTSVIGRRQLKYTATVDRDQVEYEIDSAMSIEQSLPVQVSTYLLADSTIQSDDPRIAALSDSIGLSVDSTMLLNVRRIYDLATFGLKYVRYSGTTDALTAYQLGEASCGGKSRLMVALARHLGIPARLVGGKILQAGQSTATHIWVEYYMNGYWVPFCPTNQYFAEIPAHYMVLYYGEQPFLTHTRDINFKFFFNVKKRLILPDTQGAKINKAHPLDALNVLANFRRAAISIELLRIIVMLPLGILVIVIFRNIIGLETFGTFMPALIAIGFRDTGLNNGLLLFTLIITFGTGVRAAISHLQLLHTPRLAIVLTMVIVFLLGLTTFGLSFGFTDFARVALFPLAIMTLTIERFSILTEENGLVSALKVYVSTMIVASLAYLLMSWRLLQGIIVGFPEALLLVLALYIYLGRYSGFRLMELFRFRDVLHRS